MAAVLSLPVSRTVRHGVPWDEFERLIADNAEGHVRHAYFDGILEITVPSLIHETYIEFFRRFIYSAAEEMEIDIRGIGSTTIKRTGLRKAVEPDAAYYIHNETLVRGRQEIDFAVDPPPDIVVEVDVTNDSLDKLPLFAALGFPEVWQCRRERVRILPLSGSRYVPGPSIALPGLDSATLTRFLAESLDVGSVELTRRVRRWVRARPA